MQVIWVSNKICLSISYYNHNNLCTEFVNCYSFGFQHSKKKTPNSIKKKNENETLMLL